MIKCQFARAHGSRSGATRGDWDTVSRSSPAGTLREVLTIFPQNGRKLDFVVKKKLKYFYTVCGI